MKKILLFSLLTISLFSINCYSQIGITGGMSINKDYQFGVKIISSEGIVISGEYSIKTLNFAGKEVYQFPNDVTDKKSITSASAFNIGIGTVGVFNRDNCYITGIAGIYYTNYFDSSKSKNIYYYNSYSKNFNFGCELGYIKKGFLVSLALTRHELLSLKLGIVF